MPQDDFASHFFLIRCQISTFFLFNPIFANYCFGGLILGPLVYSTAFKWKLHQCATYLLNTFLKIKLGYIAFMQ